MARGVTSCPPALSMLEFCQDKKAESFHCPSGWRQLEKRTSAPACINFQGEMDERVSEQIAQVLFPLNMIEESEGIPCPLFLVPSPIEPLTQNTA